MDSDRHAQVTHVMIQYHSSSHVSVATQHQPKFNQRVLYNPQRGALRLAAAPFTIYIFHAQQSKFKPRAQMEKTEEMKEKQVAQMPSQRRIAPNLEVKLAAIAISLNVRLRSSDMPPAMQDHALRYSRSLVDASPDATRPNPSHIARALKKV